MDLIAASCLFVRPWPIDFALHVTGNRLKSKTTANKIKKTSIATVRDPLRTFAILSAPLLSHYRLTLKKGTPRRRGLAGNAAYRRPAGKRWLRRWREGGDSRCPSGSGCRRWKSVAGAGYAKPYRPGYAESRPQYAPHLKIKSLKAFSAFMYFYLLPLPDSNPAELDNQLASKFLAKYKVV
jgi:hypothetical protein